MRRLLVCLMVISWAAGGSPRASQPSLYDSSAQAQAMVQLAQGHVDAAVAGFCAMFRPPRDGQLWTVSLGLHCDPEEVAARAALVTGPMPVFVQVKEFEGKRCYRLCAGLTTSRAVASQWVARLPKELKTAGPFPAQVIVPCDEAAVPAEHAAPGPAPPSVLPPPAPASVPPPAAAAKAQDAAKVAPPAADAEAREWFQRGLEAFRKGDHLAAFECYDKSLQIEPDRPEVLNNLGVLYLEEKRYAEAKPILQKAVDRAPSYAGAHLNLAGALWGLSERDDALAEAREAADLDPKNVAAHLTLASFLLATDSRAEAAAEARRVLELDPGNVQAKSFLDAATASPKSLDRK